jgi:hypothetical protein
MAQSAMGPFYCSGDQQIYIDLAFYEQLQNPARINVPLTPKTLNTMGSKRNIPPPFPIPATPDIC